MAATRPGTAQVDSTRPPTDVTLARNGIASSAHPFASQAAIDVLRRGGNAIDAAIAAGAVLMTVVPGAGHLGGDSFFLVNLADTNEVVALNGSGAAPRAATVERFRERGGIPYRGLWAAAVPGTVACWGTALERWGSMPLAELIQTGIQYADDGVPVSAQLHRVLNRGAETYRTFPDTAAVFFPNGKPPEIGEMMRQPGLARSLERLAQAGWRDFYEGELAAKLVSYSRDHDGLFSAEDFAEHHTDEVKPLSIDYRGFTVFEQPPVTQGIIVVLALNILKQFDLQSLEPSSAELIHLQIEALKLAFADRMHYLGDPRFADVPLEMLLSDQHAREQAARIDRRQAQSFDWQGNVQPDTTYMCVVDGAGNMVSYIHSLFAGCGVVMGDTGVFMNNRMLGFNLEEGHPNCLAPGKRPIHTLNNYLVQKDGEPILVGGTPGAHWQVQTNIQILCNTLDYGMDPAQASEAPRFLIGDQIEFGDPTVRVESRVGETVINRLRGMGHKAEAAEPWRLGGGVQLIARDPETGLYSGATDIRRASNSIIGI